MIAIRAMVAADARYVIFPLAEGVLPLQLFGATLERIGRLRWGRRLCPLNNQSVQEEVHG
jgi:hypothetical protein